ncbi:MAG TPA: hypothetical protein VGE20_09270 [Ramlibacter sp.]
MSILAAPRFLRHVLVADAISCLATGAAQVTAAQPLATLLGLPRALLAGTGWLLLAYAAVVALVAMRDSPPPRPVRAFAAGNLAWALGCVALLASGLVAPTALGVAWVLAQAAVVVLLAHLQWTALRHRRLAHHA